VITAFTALAFFYSWERALNMMLREATVLLFVLLLGVQVITLGSIVRRLPSTSSSTSSSANTGGDENDFVDRANRDAMMLFDDVDKSGNRRVMVPLITSASTVVLAANEMDALASFYDALQGPNWVWQKNTKRYGMHWSFEKTSQNGYLHDPCKEVWQGLYCSCNYSSSSYSRTVNINYYYYDYADLADTSYCNIVKIALIDFNLNGTIPFDVFGNFPRLSHLHLALNHGVRGNLSSFCGLTNNMTKFSIFNNSMGPDPVVPPPCFSKFTNLIELDLGYNSYHGIIGSSIGSLSSLVALYLDNSSLSGTIPSALGDLSELSKVQIDQNSLTGSIPSSLGKLKQLFKLLLFNNSLSSTLPSQLGGASHLVTVNFGFNKLSGSLPSTFGNFFFLQQFTMTSNSLTGSVPLGLLKLHFLQKLDLSYNSFTGSLPIMYSYEISEIILDHNKFTGKVAGMLFHVPLLASFSLTHNSFSGHLPEGYWSALPKLSHLLLAHNAFTGTLPEGLASLSNLAVLDLRGNALVSTIPQSYTQSMNVLRSLLLDDNNIGPTIPDYIGNFYSLSSTSLRNCKISGPLPPRQHKIPIQLLDLSQNPGLEGKLPDAFCNNVYDLNSPLTLNFSGTSFSCLPSCLSRSYPLLTFSYDANTPFCTSAPTFSPTPRTPVMILNRTTTIVVSVLAVFFGGIILSYVLYVLMEYWSNHKSEIGDERETDVYLMHSGRKPETHEFVRSVRDELEKRNFKVWFDEERHNKKDFVRHRKIYKGLDNTKVVCAMITDDYKSSVNHNAYKDKDDLSREFKYAEQQRKPNFMLPVLLDGALDNSREWKEALGGTLGTHLYFRLVKEDDDFDLQRKDKFDKLEEAIRGIKAQDFLHSSDVFLSHNWGQAPAHANHQRVNVVNTFLTSRNITTWFDGEKLKGDLRFMMRHGIENALIFCVFITDAYIDKISGGNQLDNCYYEFMYAVEHVKQSNKKYRSILPIVMEAKYKEKANWTGALVSLKDLVPVDLSSTDSAVFQAGCEELAEAIHDIKAQSFLHDSDVFLSHNWGQAPNHENQQRVNAVNSFLTSHKIQTWIGVEKIKGDLRFVLRHGIDNTKIFCVFITDAFVLSINEGDQLDNCLYAFSHAIIHVKPRNILPIILEAKYKEKANWTGALVSLKDLDPVDLSSTDSAVFQAGCEGLYKRIKLMLDQNALLARVRSLSNQKRKNNSFTGPDIETGVAMTDVNRHSIQVFGSRASSTSTLSSASGGRMRADSTGGSGGGGGGGGGGEHGVSWVRFSTITTSSSISSTNAIAINTTTQNPLASASAGGGRSRKISIPDMIQQAAPSPSPSPASPASSSSSSSSSSSPSATTTRTRL